MIVTLTANPAIDLNFTADQLAFDDRAYLLDRQESAGGRGVNASLVLRSFGAETLAVAPCGGKSGVRFESFLREYGIPCELVPIDGEIRTNYSITDKQGLTVKLDERGPELDPDEVARLAGAIEDRLAGASWLMLCGSLPPGVPRDFYARLISKARAASVQTLLDSNRDPFGHGLEARPTVVVPNQHEAGRVLGRVLITRSHYRNAAERIREMGAENVVISLGSRGAVALCEDGYAEVLPPRIDAVCPIGTGDAMNAAFVWAITKKSGFLDATRWGVAAGTASARLPGLNFASLEQVREVYAEVEVKRAG